MAQIIPENRQKSSSQKFAQLITNVSKEIPEHLDEYVENKKLKKNYGINLKGIKDPNTRQQIIADELQFGRKKKIADSSFLNSRNNNIAQNEQNNIYQNENIPDLNQFEQQQQNNNQSPQFRENRENPQKNTRQNQGKNTRQNQQETNFPEDYTNGKILPVKSSDEIIREGEQRARIRNENGIPTSRLEGISEVEQENNLAIQSNERVEAQKQRRQEAEIRAGNLGVSEITPYFEGVENEKRSVLGSIGNYLFGQGKEPVTIPPEVRAYFKSYGENVAKMGGSEAEINKKITDEAKKFIDDSSNIVETLPDAPRFFKKVGDLFSDTGLPNEDVKIAMRNKLKPFLEKGMYDYARDLLAQKDYDAEERETFIADLSENALKEVSKLPKINNEPKFKKDKGLFGYDITVKDLDNKYNEQTKELIHNNIRDVLKSDPNTNLILLRKAYEDKGVDWRIFQNSINQLIQNNEFTPNADQSNQDADLSQPPLSNLDSILFGLNLRGR